MRAPVVRDAGTGTIPLWQLSARFDRIAGGPTAPMRQAGAARDEATSGAMRSFEAFFLQTCVEQLMPDGEAEIFGGGMSGDMWKSLLAEQIAGVVAARGGLLGRTLPGQPAAPSAGV